MNPGELDRIITIQSKTITTDPDYGTEIVTWTDLAVKIAAQVRDALPSRAESVTLGLPVARNQTRIRFGWRDDVDSSMHILVYGDTVVTYQIVGGPASVGERKELTEVVCERISS